MTCGAGGRGAVGVAQDDRVTRVDQPAHHEQPDPVEHDGADDLVGAGGGPQQAGMNPQNAPPSAPAVRMIGMTRKPGMPTIHDQVPAQAATRPPTSN